MAGLRFAAPARWQVALLVAIPLVLTSALTVLVMRGCQPEPTPEPAIIVVAPDGGQDAVDIEDRLDAAVVEHAEEVRVIERTIIVRRVEFERARDAEESEVRAQGRDALAAWLDDFGRTVGDAGPTIIESGASDGSP